MNCKKICFHIRLNRSLSLFMIIICNSMVNLSCNVQLDSKYVIRPLLVMIMIIRKFWIHISLHKMNASITVIIVIVITYERYVIYLFGGGWLCDAGTYRFRGKPTQTNHELYLNVQLIVSISEEIVARMMQHPLLILHIEYHFRRLH